MGGPWSHTTTVPTASAAPHPRPRQEHQPAGPRTRRARPGQRQRLHDIERTPAPRVRDPGPEGARLPRRLAAATRRCRPAANSSERRRGRLEHRFLVTDAADSRMCGALGRNVAARFDAGPRRTAPVPAADTDSSPAAGHRFLSAHRGRMLGTDQDEQGRAVVRALVPQRELSATPSTCAPPATAPARSPDVRALRAGAGQRLTTSGWSPRRLRVAAARTASPTRTGPRPYGAAAPPCPQREHPDRQCPR